MREAVNGQVAGEFDAGAMEIEDQLAQEKGFRFHVMGISKGKVLKVVNALPMSREMFVAETKEAAIRLAMSSVTPEKMHGFFRKSLVPCLPKSPSELAAEDEEAALSVPG